MMSALKRRRVEDNQVLDIEQGTDYAETKEESEAVREKQVAEFHQARTMLSTQDYICKGENSPPLRFIQSTLVPTKPNHSIRWFERLGSNYMPTTAFSFEITYNCLNNKINPLQDELNGAGFTVQYQYLPYSIFSMDRYLTYAIVNNVSSNFQNFLAVGDILLKVQNEDFFYKPGDPQLSEENGVREATLNKFNNLEINTTTKIRLLRVAGTSYSSSISVCDILLFANEKVPSVRFKVKKSTVMNRDKQPIIKSELEVTEMEHTVRHVFIFQCQTNFLKDDISI